MRNRGETTLLGKQRQVWPLYENKEAECYETKKADEYCQK
jgi:hypothetical protein